MNEEERTRPGAGGEETREAPEEGPGEAPPRASGEAPRHAGRGCWLRAAVYLLVAIALAAAGGWLWLQGSGARTKARDLLAGRLADYFGRDVSVGALHWTLYPTSVELDDVVIPGDRPGAPPVARVPRLEIHARLTGWKGWLEPEIEISQVFVERPEVYLEVRRDGSNNLPRFGTGGGGGGRAQIHLGAVVVERGRFHLGELELPLDLEAHSVFARLIGTGGQGGNEVEGLVTAQQVRVVLPPGTPYVAAFSGKARFGPERVEILTSRLSGPDLRATAHGTLRVPEETRRLDLQVAAEGQVALAADLGYLDASEPPIAGPFRFDGGLVWRPEGWTVEGALSSRRLVQDRRVLSDVSGTLRVVPDGVRYQIDHAAYAGGSFSGLVSGDLGAAETPFQVDLQVVDLGLPELIADQDLPLEGLHGRVSGQVSYRFTTDDPEAGSGWADLQVRSVRQDVAGPGLALTGQVPLEIDRGVVRSQAVRLVSASGSQVVHAAGSFDISAVSGDYRYELSTRDVGQLAELVPVDPGEPRPPWLPTAGHGEAQGTLTIRPGVVTTDVSFKLADVASPGLAAETLNGSARVGTQGLRHLLLEASAAGGALMVVGSVPFEEGVGIVPFDLTVDAASWPNDERLAAWLPVALPVAGPVSGRLTLSGSLDELSGTADVEVEPATLAGIPTDSLVADLSFDPRRLQVQRAVVHTGAGEVRGEGTLDFATDALDFRVQAPSIDLEREPFSSALPGDVQGRLALAGTVSGTLERPRIEASVTTEGLTLAQHPVGGDGVARLRVAWDGEQVSARGEVPGILTIDGGGALSTERADLSFHLASQHVGDAVRALVPAVPEDFHGDLEGDLTVAGAFADPRALAVRLELPTLNLDYQDHALVNAEPVVVRYTGPALEVDSLYLQEPGTDSELFVHGSVGLQGELPLDLRLQGSISTDWAGLFLPQADLTGTFDVLATVRGTVSEPAINGEGELRDASLVFEGIPESLEELSAVVLFYPRQLVLDHLVARVGGGSVQASGRVGLYGEHGPEYRLQASAEGVTLRYPEGFWFQADAALSLLSTPDGRLVRGVVQLDRAYYVKDVETGLLQLMRRALRAERLQVAATNELETSTQLAVSVEAPQGNVRVRNNLADLKGTADLTIRGTVARPVLFGTVEFERGGTLVYSDDEFDVERARITFANPAEIDPLIDLVATTTVREYDVTLTLSGKLDTLQAKVASSPPLADLDIIGLLTTGQPLGQTGNLPGPGTLPATGTLPGSGSLTESSSSPEGFSAETFLAGQAASVVAKRVNSLFGFDKFRISPVGTTTGGSISGVGVTVGKRLSKSVFVTYTEQPSTQQQSFLQVEWQIDRHLTLVFTATAQDTYRIDARWDQRF